MCLTVFWSKWSIHVPTWKLASFPGVRNTVGTHCSAYMEIHVYDKTHRIQKGHLRTNAYTVVTLTIIQEFGVLVDYTHAQTVDPRTTCVPSVISLGTRLA